MPIKILDSSFFFLDIPLEGEFAIPSAVERELKDLIAKTKLETYRAKGLFISEPSADSQKKVINAAEKSGDITVISDTDVDVIALALELNGEVVTDDYALSNTAQTLGIKVIPLQQRAAKKRKWKYRCMGCKKLHEKPGICDVCGAEIKRMFK
ncbi:MAG: nucleotide-binding protein [Methanomicrobiaceae archaeon]|nr:nucleotide-binding protein [Methanomicrobiaceae archaeon]